MAAHSGCRGTLCPHKSAMGFSQSSSMEMTLQWFWAVLIFAAHSLDIIEPEPLLCSVSRAFKGNSKEVLKHPANLGEADAAHSFKREGVQVGDSGGGVRICNGTHLNGSHLQSLCKMTNANQAWKCFLPAITIKPRDANILCLYLSFSPL